MKLLPRNDHSYLSHLLLSGIKFAKMKQLFLRLELFDYVTLQLHDSARTLSSARFFFNDMVRSFFAMESRIGILARIIENDDFESALVRI